MALALYRQDATGFLVIRDNPGAGYTAISAMPTSSISARANWWRDLDVYGQSSAWHPSVAAAAQNPDPNANYNASNAQNGSAIPAPAVATNGTAVDHTISTSGNADISFEWSWSGDESTIDGFIVYLRQSTSSAAYTFGSSPAEEQTFVVPPNKRAAFFFSMPCNLYYTFGVQAYRVVAPNINASGRVVSTLIKATGAGENPYRPSANVAFAGDLTGTINGGIPGAFATTDQINNSNQGSLVGNDVFDARVIAPGVLHRQIGARSQVSVPWSDASNWASSVSGSVWLSPLTLAANANRSSVVILVSARFGHSGDTADKFGYCNVVLGIGAQTLTAYTVEDTVQYGINTLSWLYYDYPCGTAARTYYIGLRQDMESSSDSILTEYNVVILEFSKSE